MGEGFTRNRESSYRRAPARAWGWARPPRAAHARAPDRWPARGARVCNGTGSKYGAGIHLYRNRITNQINSCDAAALLSEAQPAVITSRRAPRHRLPDSRMGMRTAPLAGDDITHVQPRVVALRVRVRVVHGVVASRVHTTCGGVTCGGAWSAAGRARPTARHRTHRRCGRGRGRHDRTSSIQRVRA